MIRVVIADEQNLVRTGLALLLAESDGIEVVGVASTAEEAVRAASATAADVVLMELGLADMDGVAAIRRLAARAPHCRILVLSSFDRGTRVVEALKAGAVDHLPMASEPADMVAAIHAAAARDGASTAAVDGHPDSDGHAREPGRGARLTERDWDVLLLLAQGHSNKVIAHRLDVSVSTVKTHLTRIYRVLGVAGRTQAALWAQEQGLDRLTGRRDG